MVGEAVGARVKLAIGEVPLAVDERDGTETLYVAVSDRGILASRDGGRTFTTRYQE